LETQNPAVKYAIEQLIKTAHKHGIKIGICGQAPSDYPEIVEFLVENGIDSISLPPRRDRANEEDSSGS
jgi:pyruvate,water dikinase